MVFVYYFRKVNVCDRLIVHCTFLSAGALFDARLCSSELATAQTHKFFTLLKADTQPRSRNTTPNMSSLYAIKRPGIWRVWSGHQLNYFFNCNFYPGTSVPSVTHLVFLFPVVTVLYWCIVYWLHHNKKPSRFQDKGAIWRNEEQYSPPWEVIDLPSRKNDDFFKIKTQTD